MSTKCLHTFRAGVGFVCVSQVTEACAQQMAACTRPPAVRLASLALTLTLKNFDSQIDIEKH